jgi:hypothetical protein
MGSAGPCSAIRRSVRSPPRRSQRLQATSSTGRRAGQLGRVWRIRALTCRPNPGLSAAAGSPA